MGYSGVDYVPRTPRLGLVRTSTTRVEWEAPPRHVETDEERYARLFRKRERAAERQRQHRERQDELARDAETLLSGIVRAR
jgi:hypothetical protein